MNIHEGCILILDFGSQYSQLIARQIREIGVYCEIYPADISPEVIQSLNPAGIILSGVPETVTAVSTLCAPEIVFALGCPVLGICYGMHTMAQQLGGEVISGAKREFGYAQVNVCAKSNLLDGIEDHITENNLSLLDVWMSHGDAVSRLPASFNIIANTQTCKIAAMADEKRRFYGLQFHPEVSHTRQGKRIFERFILIICGCKPSWISKNIIDD